MLALWQRIIALGWHTYIHKKCLRSFFYVSLVEQHLFRFISHYIRNHMAIQLNYSWNELLQWQQQPWQLGENRREEKKKYAGFSNRHNSSPNTIFDRNVSVKAVFKWKLFVFFCRLPFFLHCSGILTTHYFCSLLNTYIFFSKNPEGGGGGM